MHVRFSVSQFTKGKIPTVYKLSNIRYGFTCPFSPISPIPYTRTLPIKGIAPSPLCHASAASKAEQGEGKPVILFPDIFSDVLFLVTVSKFSLIKLKPLSYVKKFLFKCVKFVEVSTHNCSFNRAKFDSSPRFLALIFFFH